MNTREQNDLYFGHPGFDDTPTPRPVEDDDACGKCGHPRWMHGPPHWRCHMMDWEARRACRCRMFQEYRWH